MAYRARASRASGLEGKRVWMPGRLEGQWLTGQRGSRARGLEGKGLEAGGLVLVCQGTRGSVTFKGTQD